MSTNRSNLRAALDALACIDVLDLDDTASPFADRVDRMNAKAAITDKPGHHQLSPLVAEKSHGHRPSNNSRNRLLAVLSAGDRDLLAQSLEDIELDAHQVLEAPNDPVSYVYFVESGMVSVNL